MVFRYKKPDPLMMSFAAVAAILVSFIALPLAATVAMEQPGDIAAALGDDDVRSAILTSFAAALIATALSLLLGTPLAYLMARRRFPGKAAVQTVIDLPVVIPHTISGIALLVVFGRMGLFSEGMSMLGLRFEDHMAGIVAAMMFVSASFVVNSLRDGFEKVDERLENVARSLGATRLGTFLTVTLPLARSSFVTGAVMAWARAVSEFGAVMVIAYFPKVIPTLAYERNVRGGLSESMPIAALLILLCVGVFVLVRALAEFLDRQGADDE
ncbi:MAG: ABC transporter permease [Thermoplasmata archaeon]